MRKTSKEENMEAHRPGRDHWRPEKRGEAWENAQGIHEYNQERKQHRRPERHHIVLWSGDMGDGKTLNAGRSDLAYYLDGMPVTANSSYKFCDTLEGAEQFNLDDTIEDNSANLFDEVHIISERYAVASVRQRHFSNEMSMFRKGGKRVNMVTAHEEDISPAVKREADWVNYPIKHIPAVVKRGGNWPGLPPWCFYRIVRIGPKPWRGQRLSDRMPEAGVARPPVGVFIDYPNPRDLYLAAAVIDSWDKPDLTVAMRLGAKEMRASWDEKGSGAQEEGRDVYADVTHALARALASGEELYEEHLHLGYLGALVRKYAPGPPIDDYELKDALRMNRVPVSTRDRIRRSALLKALNWHEGANPLGV